MPDNDFSGLYSRFGQISHYRFALQVYSLFFQMVDKDVTLADRVYALSVFGHDYITDKIHKIALHRNGLPTMKRRLLGIWDLIEVKEY